MPQGSGLALASVNHLSRSLERQKVSDQLANIETLTDQMHARLINQSPLRASTQTVPRRRGFKIGATHDSVLQEPIASTKNLFAMIMGLRGLSIHAKTSWGESSRKTVLMAAIEWADAHDYSGIAHKSLLGIVAGALFWNDVVTEMDFFPTPPASKCMQEMYSRWFGVPIKVGDLLMHETCNHQTNPVRKEEWKLYAWSDDTASWGSPHIHVEYQRRSFFGQYSALSEDEGLDLWIKR